MKITGFNTTGENGIYKLVIVGGGPGGVGIFIRAARLGLFPRLVNPAMYGVEEDQHVATSLGLKQLGVALIHDGDECTFGSGNLGSYTINSNTFAKSLLGSILDERTDLDPPESIRGTFLSRMECYDSKAKLEQAGNAPVLLKDIGSFLTDVGGEVLRELADVKYANSSRCFFHSRGLSFQQLQNDSGCPYIRLRVRDCNTNSEFDILAEHIVLAMGGKQVKPLLGSPALDKKLFLSDYCLREEGAAALKDHLVQFKDPTVCIVGGSHSAFSVAWMLLNPSLCKNKDSKSKSAVVAPHLGPKSITILHRSSITCYYMTRKEAESDGLIGATVDRAGSVNTFTGLREDAKRLYKSIHSKKEIRARLFQINERGCQNLSTKAYESASAIVWSCGYSTNMIPAHDCDGQTIQFLQEHGMVKLNMSGNLMRTVAGATRETAYRTISNVYGIGIGFFLRANVSEMGNEARADGVTVYHRRGASLVLAGIFGDSVYGIGSKTFEEMVEKNDKKKLCLSGSKPNEIRAEGHGTKRLLAVNKLSSVKAATSALKSLRLDQKPIVIAGGQLSKKLVSPMTMGDEGTIDKSRALCSLSHR